MIEFLMRPFNSSGNFQLERTAKVLVRLHSADCYSQNAQIPSHRPDRDQ